MAVSLDARAALIGLGGAGARIVQGFFETGATGSALVINLEGEEVVAPSREALRSVSVAHPDLSLETLIREGTHGDWSEKPDQERLRRLASWRMTLSDAPNIPLDFGTGQIRAVGRMMILRSERLIRDSLMRVAGEHASVTVAASLSGGFGSAIMTDVIDWLFEIRSDLMVRVVWLADYPPGLFHHGFERDWNEAAALLEALSTRDRHGVTQLQYVIIPSGNSDVIAQAIRAIVNPSPSDSALDPLDEALKHVAERIFFEPEFKTPSWWRTRPIAESSGLTRSQRRHLIRGYINAAAGGAIRTDADTGSPRLIVKGPDGDARDVQLLTLPPDRVSPLPRILECARLLMAHPRAAESIGLLLAWADAPIVKAKISDGGGAEHSDPAGYELHYLGMATPRRSSQGEQLDVRRFVTRQLELVRALRDRPYDGQEGLDRRGMPVPPETLFRDIAEDYEFVLQQMSREIQEQRGSQSVSHREEGAHQAFGTEARTGRTFARFTKNLRPFWVVRYAVPALLAALSIGLFVWALSTSDNGRESLANSADVVAGVMAGFAVCLGAIALISSIQNSSVTAVRTDRLFASCIAVCEAVAMFEVALEKARLTPAHADVTDNAWSHPSVQLAGKVLRQRFDTALEDGLFRLLAARDVERRTATHRLDESLALQVFVVFDDLSRAEKIDTTRGAAPLAGAANVCRLAGRLRDEIEALSYRDVARSVRSRGSLIRRSEELARSV
jgi:hypothetical protein